jgi:hypothetical protein
MVCPAIIAGELVVDPEDVNPVTEELLAEAVQAKLAAPELFEVKVTGVEVEPLHIDSAKEAFVREGVPITVTVIVAGLLGQPLTVCVTE